MGGPEVSSESGSSLRGLLPDFRDKARHCHYINQLRGELSRTAQALERLVDSMSQHDGEHESRLRQALKTIRDLARDPVAAPIAQVLRSVGEAIDGAIEQFRQQQLTVSQFLEEISQLHKRIDALELEAPRTN